MGASAMSQRRISQMTPRHCPTQRRRCSWGCRRSSCFRRCDAAKGDKIARCPCRVARESASHVFSRCEVPQVGWCGTKQLRS